MVVGNYRYHEEGPRGEDFPLVGSAVVHSYIVPEREEDPSMATLRACVGVIRHGRERAAAARAQRRRGIKSPAGARARGVGASPQ